MPIEEKGSAEELARLRGEREDADRRYNDALTKLDAAIQRPLDARSRRRLRSCAKITG